jgi:hypothetical protein
LKIEESFSFQFGVRLSQGLTETAHGGMIKEVNNAISHLGEAEQAKAHAI